MKTHYRYEGSVMDIHKSRQSFICFDCGGVYKLHYLSPLSNGNDVCRFCDTMEDHDDDYESESDWEDYSD